MAKMPDLPPQERLQPSLLDRLTDLKPASKVDLQNSRGRVARLERVFETIKQRHGIGEGAVKRLEQLMGGFIVAQRKLEEMEHQRASDGETRTLRTDMESCRAKIARLALELEAAKKEEAIDDEAYRSLLELMAERDRLSDYESRRQKEPRQQRVLSVREQRKNVIRDLAWLFNTINLSATDDLSDYSEVPRSTLNFGLPDLSGKATVGIEIRDLERLLLKTIHNFEPRILQETLKVRVVKSEEQMSQRALTFEIEGELWNIPEPLHLFLKTELDLSDGSVNITDYGG
jgi:type VI secretion system protein ImpF